MDVRLTPLFVRPKASRLRRFMGARVVSKDICWEGYHIPGAWVEALVLFALDVARVVEH